MLCDLPGFWKGSTEAMLLLLRVSFSTRALLIAAACAAAGCGGPDVPAPRLVLLYATCTLNKGFLSPYRAGVGWTPSLAAFAGRGVVFRRHETESGFSGIAFASIFSGMQADGHGVFSHPARLPDDVPTITEAFAAAGWEVYFWADHEMASPELNYAQGVAPERLFRGGARLGARDPRRRDPDREGFLQADDPRLQRILDRLAQDPRARALLVTNFTVTHAPYSAAWVEDFCRAHAGECSDLSREAFERWAETFWEHYVDLSWNFDATAARLGLSAEDVRGLESAADRLYKANVRRLDGLFGAVLREIDARGLDGESVVAFTADHGEVLHGPGAVLPWNHGFTLAPEELSVPWIVAAPGVEPGVFEGVTRSIDVFPTLAGLAGVPVPEGVAGVDLSPALRGIAPPPVLEAFSHTALVPLSLLRESRRRGGTRLDRLVPRRDPRLMAVGLRADDRVYELWPTPDAAPRRAVFDLARDPHEERDLHDPADAGQGAVFERLERYRAALLRRFEADSKHHVPIPAARERELLRQLGYIE